MGTPTKTIVYRKTLQEKLHVEVGGPVENLLHEFSTQKFVTQILHPFLSFCICVLAIRMVEQSGTDVLRPEQRACFHSACILYAAFHRCNSNT